MSKKTIVLNEGNFEAQALRKDGVPVLVDFWANWCAPCRTMEPVLESLAAELDGQVRVGKVNVDEEPSLASAARVEAIPTLVLLKDGKVEDVFVGVQSKQKLKARLEQLRGGDPAPTAFSKSSALN